MQAQGSQWIKVRSRQLIVVRRPPWPSSAGSVVTEAMTGILGMD